MSDRDVLSYHECQTDLEFKTTPINFTS